MIRFCVVVNSSPSDNQASDCVKSFSKVLELPALISDMDLYVKVAERTIVVRLADRQIYWSEANNQYKCTGVFEYPSVELQHFVDDSSWQEVTKQ
jgi:hypothetical protein